MTEKDETTEVVEDAAQQPDDAAGSVKKGGLIIILIILLSLCWYLLADRFTPYTSQARVQGYVVGVAPKVAGVVTQVWVRNNQEVRRANACLKLIHRNTALPWRRRGLTWVMPRARSVPVTQPLTRPVPTCWRHRRMH